MYDQEKMQAWLDEIKDLCRDHPSWYAIFEKAYTNTLDEAVKILDDGTTFVLTGDIPAMWLRDSTAQLKPYILQAKEDPDLCRLIGGLVTRQMRYICHDPYANSFNEAENWKGHHETDHSQLSGWIWERKYELDSLCYPLQLAYLLWRETGYRYHLNDDFVEGVRKILATIKLEQDHRYSTYRFTRDTDRQEDTLAQDGFGPEFAATGMSWSAFRPSDDACQYPYLIPANMFAVVVLDYMSLLFRDVKPCSDYLELASAARDLAIQIRQGIEEHGLTRNVNGQTIYAYEVDGLGRKSIMDDPNVPSLLSAPYLGYLKADDPIYLATRATILSDENPYFYEGICASGLGSSHTWDRYIWPIALAIEGLTSPDKAVKKDILDLLVSCDGGTGLMHESFHVDDPNRYTREWFSWANMMFCELVLDYLDRRIPA